MYNTLQGSISMMVAFSKIDRRKHTNLPPGNSVPGKKAKPSTKHEESME